MNAETQKILLLDYQELPSNIMTSIMYYGQFSNDSLLSILKEAESGMTSNWFDFTPAFGQTFKNTLTPGHLQSMYDEYLENKENKKSYNMKKYIDEHNLHLVKWLIDNRKKLDLDVDDILINITFPSMKIVKRR